MHVIAHRGASIERPENTLAAFQRALELAPFAIELDIHLSADGIPVVIHDKTVDRTTNGHGEVRELMLADLQSLDAGDGEKVPTLGEVLDLIGNRAHLFLEVKEPDVVDIVLVTMAERVDARWTMLCGDPRTVAGVRSRYPNVELCVGTGYLGDITDEDARRRSLDEGIAAAREVGAAILMVHDSGIDVEAVRRVQAAGLAIWAWTVNDVARMQALAAMNVDYLCTDDAGRAVHLNI